jgi:hypothetical protein
MDSNSQIAAAMEAARQKIAERLFYAIVWLQQQHMQRVSKPAVKVGKTWIEASKPGEYPRLRTAHGRAGVEIDCKGGPVDVISNGMIARLGQSQASFYMLHLELNKDRLGYIKTAEDLKAMVAALVTGTAP